MTDPLRDTTKKMWNLPPATPDEIKDMIRLMDGEGTRTTLSGPEDAAVLALCERYGFGAVMDSAARQWFKRDPNGAHVVGPGAAIARSVWEAVNGKAVGDLWQAFARVGPELTSAERVSADQARLMNDQQILLHSCLDALEEISRRSGANIHPDEPADRDAAWAAARARKAMKDV
jgi:hypothetical protein